jgi:hypothetical protein
MEVLKRFHIRQYKLQRHNTENSKQIFLEKELLGLSPNFHINVSVSDLYIFPGSVCLFCCRNIYGPILRIYKSPTDTLM